MKLFTIKSLLLSISLSSFSAWGQQVVTLTPQPFNGSGGVAVNAAGEVFVGDFGPTLGNSTGAIVSKIGKDGSVNIFASGMVGASGNEFGPAGNLFQSNISGGFISKIDPAGNVSTFTSTGIVAPVGVAVADDGTVYIANCGNNTIQRISADGTTSTTIASGGLLSCPNGLTFADDGNLYTCNFNNGNVLQIPLTGQINLVATLPGGLFAPAGNNGHLTFANGVLYVVARGANQIYEVTLTGQVRLLAGTGAFGNGDGKALQATITLANGIDASPDGDTLYFNNQVPISNTTLDPVLVRMIVGLNSTELDADLDGRQQATPVITPGNGSAFFFLKPDSSQLTYDVKVMGLSGPITATHIHNAPAGIDGSIVKTLDFSGNIIKGVWKTGDSEPLTPELIEQLMSGNLYVNVHTAANPGGEIRGQILMSTPPETEAAQVHATGNLNIGVFNDGFIGANFNFAGPGASWKGTNALFTGGPIFGTSSAGSVNGLLGSFLLNSDLRIVESDYSSGFSTNANFDQIARATLSDDVAPTPYGVEIHQYSYSNTGEEFVFVRYGYVNKTATALNNFYAGLFLDWDLGSAGTNSGGYLLEKNLVYNFDNGGAPYYYGVAAINGVSGMLTASTPSTAFRSEAFTQISTIDTNPITADGDFRTWIGSGPFNIAPGDTAWATFAFVAGDDLNEIRSHANDAGVKAFDLGWSDIQVGIGTDIPAGVPGKFALEQNFPNPFNPATTINYELPIATDLKLNVYNILGEKVRTLVNERQEAGAWSIDWDGKNDFGEAVASGIYIYKIAADAFVQSRKMILLK